MSIEAVSVIDADLARVDAASLRLASAMAQQHTGADAAPGEVERGHAAVQAAEADLAQAEAAVHADQAAPAAVSASHAVTDPGGIVV